MPQRDGNEWAAHRYGKVFERKRSASVNNAQMQLVDWQNQSYPSFKIWAMRETRLPISEPFWKLKCLRILNDN